MNRIFFVAFCILICGCSTTHNIKVSQKHFNVLKMEHLKKENYKFEIPNIEKQGENYTFTPNEVDKIIRNNKRFTTIIENKTNEANTKLSYYEDTIKNLGGVFEEKER